LAWFKIASALQNKIPTGQKTAGQIILTSDSCNMYWDVDGNTRIKITDVIELPNEAARTGLAAPFEKFYYVVSTGVMWHYHASAWHPINPPLTASDIPNLDWSKITTGKPTTVSGYGITDAITGAGSGLTKDGANLKLAPSGAAAGTYKSVTVNANGIVTAGSNPALTTLTTLDGGYSIGFRINADGTMTVVFN
jgi:hypothetical protein